MVPGRSRWCVWAGIVALEPGHHGRLQAPLAEPEIQNAFKPGYPVAGAQGCIAGKVVQPGHGVGLALAFAVVQKYPVELVTLASGSGLAPGGRYSVGVT
jgi:hypothetical protein